MRRLRRSQGDDDVLFHLSVTKNGLYQPIFCLVPICHSAYRGVVELFLNLFDTLISIGILRNRFESAAATVSRDESIQSLLGIGTDGEKLQAIADRSDSSPLAGTVRFQALPASLGPDAIRQTGNHG